MTNADQTRIVEELMKVHRLSERDAASLMLTIQPVVDDIVRRHQGEGK